MKTFLKIFITLVVVAGAFTAYLVFQPPRAMQQSATRPAVPPVQRNASGSIIGEGQNAWVRQFDDEGRLASRFRAEKWEPQKNGLVRVIRPEAELLLKGGKDKDGKDKPRPLVRIRGDDGEVVVQSLPDAAATDKPLASSQAGSPNTPTGKGASVGPAQPPSSGRLNGVVIDVFETEDAKEPRVTLRTNNIVFDNDTFRISTESYPADDGSTVPPDQVKVSVTGPDFEFYGRGLTVRWNDLDERLDLLRIAHGDHLVIKNIEAFSSGDLPLGVPAPATAAPTASTRAPALDLLASADPGAALALASADRRRKGAVAAPASRPVRRKPKSAGGKDDQPVYRAAFHEDVRVVQGEQPLATARLMNIDFLAGERKSDTPATKPASTRKADANGESAAPAATEPAATRDVATSQPVESAATSQPAATAPSTAPSAQPVTVYWTGELTVTPSPIPAATSPATAPTTLPSTVAPADQPLPPGEARVELVGAPAVLTHAPLDIRTGRFVWRTDGRLALDAAADVPRVLITQRPADGQGPDTTVSTEGLTYSRGERVAVLRGDSRVLAPVGGEPGAETGAAPAMIDAAWRETAEFKLVGEREDEMWVEHAAFAGKVNVTAPQGLVRSEQLELTFDPPTPKPAATTRPATHPATQTAQPPDTRLATRAAGDSSPNLRRIVATDGVYCELIDAAKGKQLVECQRLALDTARSETGELYPRVVDASGVVRASTAEQSLDAGHVVLQLRPARTAPATQPTQAEDGAGAGAIAATHPAPFNGTVPFTGKGQWALADATSVGVARTMRPKTDPAAAFELESMTATDSVRVASLDGGVATGKRLVVTVGDDGTPRVELTGDPARVEHANASGTLTGPRIEVDPKTGVARVVGPGTMRAVQREERKDGAGVLADAAAGGTLTLDAPARPIEVTWANGADVRGGEDRIDITGAVSLWITDVDGSVRTATAGRVSVELAKKAPETPAGNGKADAPANPPADAPGDSAADAPERAKKAKPAGGVQFAQSMNMDLFEGKEVSKVHLYDNAVINSKLVGDDGSVLRQFHLKAQTITYDARSRHLTVPGPGQMLVEAHDGPAGDEPKQAAGKGRDDVAAFTSGNGVTAFQWAQKLEYDEAAGRAVMDGSVVVSHQPDRKGDAPVRIDSDTLTATFETQRGAASQPEKAVAKGASDGTSVGDAGATKLQMRSMTARGNILISREGSELTAHEISYDPATEWVVARGTPRNPASFSASAGAGTMRAGELWLNTRTWQVKVKDVNTRLGVGEIKR